MYCPTSSGVVTLKTGRRGVPGSNPGRACRPSHSKFSVVSLRNSRKCGLESLRNTPTEGIPLIGSGPINGQLALKPTTKTTLADSFYLP